MQPYFFGLIHTLAHGEGRLLTPPVLKELYMHSKRYAVLLLCVAAVISITVPECYAIPAFSRQYGTSCTTCHSNFPKLNDFGKSFKDAGFKFPKDDESFMKIPPVMLGAPAQKEMFPKVIWWSLMVLIPAPINKQDYP